MGPLRLLVAMGVLASSAVLFTQAAPTDVLGPPRTLEGDTDINQPAKDESLDGDNKKDIQEEVTTEERFYRVYENGTIEFKTALSNGHIQYQKISNKVVDGKTIQVYEGYVSLRYADGRYGTSYYIADENGYRRTRVEVDTKPPVLPKSGPNPVDLENEQEARSPVGTNILAEESEASVPPTTEGNLYPTTEGDGIISVEDTTLSLLPSTEVNLSDSETTTTAEETSTLPTTEEDIKTTAEDERVDATTVLPTTDVTGSDAEDSADNEASTVISGNDDPLSSTQYPTLPAIEGIEEKVTELPVIEDTPTTTEEVLGGIKVNDNSEEVTTTEGNSIATESTELPSNTHDIKEDEEGSRGILPTTEEAIATITENSSINPTEDNTPITLTEAPTVEENASKSSEDLPGNTDLTAINDDEYLDPITESSSTRGSQEDIITTEPSSRDEDIEATTLLPKAESPGLSSTIDSDLPAVDSVESEASTELPALEGDIKTGGTEAEVPAESEASTKLPALEGDITIDGTTAEVPTEATPSDDNKLEVLAATEGIETKSNEASTDGTYLQASTEVPALPATEEIAIKANVASSELPTVSTDLPILTVSEKTSTNHTEDGAIQNEATNQLSTSDEAGDELSTEIPDELVTKSAEDNSILSEVSTELPVDNENLGLSTESAVSSSSWPALPLVDNASTELPVSENSSVNATKSAEGNGADQLASEKVLEASTDFPTHADSDRTTINPEEDNTTTEAGDEKLETVAKIEEVPITEEDTIKTA